MYNNRVRGILFCGEEIESEESKTATDRESNKI